MSQPGYDALAALYADTFPTPYQSPLESHAVACFADAVVGQAIAGTVIDVGSGVGHVTAELSRLGLDVVGVEPSSGMRAIAQSTYPDCRFIEDDAHLAGPAAGIRVGAILARYSLIHVDPTTLPEIVETWAARVSDGGHLLIAGQALDTEGHAEFDHRVARAWRWNPDALATILRDAGLDEAWRMISRPDAEHRFPEFHLLAVRQTRARSL